MTVPRSSGELPGLVVPPPLLQLLRDLLHERMGLHFEPGRFDTMLEKLEPRALAHGFTSLLDYYYLLKYDEGGKEEWRRVMDAFSVQETYFWREYDQVRALVDVIVPAWFRAHSGPLRIWSAACATGEEPYTLALALEEGGWGGWPIEIYASDASDSALTRARAAVYRERSFRALPSALRRKYFTPHQQGEQLRPDIAARVTFQWANLVDPSTFPAGSTFPVIFCRNVFIYFSTPAIKRVVEAFAPRVPTHGHLFVGAAESLLKVTDLFELQEVQGAFAYVRRPTG